MGTAFAIYRLRTETCTDDLLIANIEALTSGENSNEFNCVMYKDICNFYISSEFQMNIIRKKFPGLGGVDMNTYIDLGAGTQIYRQKRPGEYGVRCGEDITCNKLLQQIGLLN